MEYSVEDLKKLALEEGFTNAGQLNLKALVFMPEVRQMCSADKCHAYGRNWRCPPACGTLEESAALAAYETIERAGKEHADCFIKMMRKIKAMYPDVLGMGAGTCRRCKSCTYPDAPCRFPEDSYSSMEAYGLWVSKVCELSGIPYNYGPNTIAYTSCFLLK